MSREAVNFVPCGRTRHYTRRRLFSTGYVAMSDDGPVVPLKARPCPICGKPVVQRFRPFCSKRCADIDLGRWLKGGYAIASEDEPDMDDDGFDEA